MNPLFIFGGLAVIGAMVAMQSQGGNDVDRGNIYDPMFRDDSSGVLPEYYQDTGASEEAYWSGTPEGRHVQIPGRAK
jgi:hypothetical protein